MSERETAAAIADRAAEWVARLDRAGEDRVVLAELESWLSGDERRRGAYFRARSAWLSLDRAGVLAGAAGMGAEPAAGRPGRRWIWGGGMAAAAAAVLLLFGLSGPAPQRIETAIGEIRRVPLADGSIAAVNTATRLSVEMEPERRTIALDAGEAWFQVAHDRARPFVVEAGDVRVRAVGTAFSVRRLDLGAQIRVTEGVVEIWRTGDDAYRRRVSAGATALVAERAAVAPVIAVDGDGEQRLAWRTGQLIFNGDTLGNAAAELNRYNEIQVRIADPALAAERFVGRFRPNEPDAFARAAAGILDARVEQRDGEIVLSRK